MPLVHHRRAWSAVGGVQMSHCTVGIMLIVLGRLRKTVLVSDSVNKDIFDSVHPKNVCFLSA